MTPLTRTRPADGTSADVLVVGGGITGAAIAYEAASRGLDVVLVEKDDFGGATSAATGKLIHGGLRYLKQLEVGLVRESLAERRTLSVIAPNLVSPIAMVLPGAGLVERAGLTAYDLLSLDRNRVADRSKRIPRHRSLSSDDLASLGLPDLPSPVLFHDAMMLSPERLTLAFLRSAVAHGARVANGVRVDALLGGPQRAVGARVVDELEGGTTEITAGVVVNATGAWAQELVGAPAPRVRSEGIYLVTRQITPTMVLTVTPHGHFSFAPWRGHSLIGPTETPYEGPVSQWRLTRAAIETFVERINAASLLPVALSMDDVVAAYGGLRPLTESAGADTYRASRAAELVDHARDGREGLVSATGGKYTTSRAFAQHAVDAVAAKLGRRIAPSTTARVPLAGCDVPDLPAAIAATAARHPGLAADTVDLVVRHYGTDAEAVLALAESDPALAKRATADGEPLATVAWAARHEMPRSLADILLRRTGIGTLGDPGDVLGREAARIAGEVLGWSPARQAAEWRDARRAVSLPVD
ncbi:glycerol-3-phosphate dehydrogenase/oxidase [Nocardioides sp. GY 10127]|uniref:glycerol-3-phosphate dehydrogenase/oxidase n=1 Tax=Nocardioides sp. GY 10127 TaxID=2569762 RepID=UPI0010A86657|nr:glycerol-3-phosphate dehydrogenase/oxidase [Nocardioides sp. GY 10127]TIC82584.1 glycerol-3-phosphate dehydrogenase/oxidase [Nocardioides sp. GY 10127]